VRKESLRGFAITLTQGRFAEVDCEDAVALRVFKWRAFRAGGTWYAATTIGGKTVLMHRLILGAKDGSTVDHKDHNGLNNRRGNLRLCSTSQNAMNKRSGRKFKGVWNLRGGKFGAAIVAGSERIFLGVFGCAEAAACAYDHAARRHFGEFACTNNLRAANDT
jgi:hypothetical protein